MTAKEGTLGRNLTALLGHQTNNALLSEGPKGNPHSLPISRLKPGKYQPRGDISESGLEELAISIRSQGIIQPLVVRPLNLENYEIIAGERRWRAAQLAGLTEVPVAIKDVDDETAMAMALIENLQREDLNAMDQARAMNQLITEFKLSHHQVAEILGKSRASITNYLRLMGLAGTVKTLLEHGDIDMGHARALLALPENQQPQVAQIVVAKHLSVRETEALINRVKSGKKPVPPKDPIQQAWVDKIKSLSERLNTHIHIKPGPSGKGKLVIEYKDQTVLENILERITKQ